MQEAGPSPAERKFCDMARWNTCRSQRASSGTQDAAPRASIGPAKPVKLARAGKLVKPPAGAAGSPRDPAL
jgi:hypothetical protein